MFNLGIGSLLVGSLIYLIGDMFIVGFRDPSEERMQVFGLSAKENKIAAYMLDGSNRRLFLGLLCGVLGAPFVVLASLHLWTLLRPGVLRTVLLAVYLIGTTSAPLAHGGFYFLGRVAKDLYPLAVERGLQDKEKTLFRDLYKTVMLVWSLAVVSMLISFILLIAGIITKQAALPLWMILLTPIFIVPLYSFLDAKLRLPAVLHGAGLNIALLVYAIGVMLAH